MAKIYEFPIKKTDGEKMKEKLSVDCQKLINLLNLLADLLSNMPEDEQHGQNYQSCRDKIQFYSPDEIIKKINTDDEAGVKANPLFYSALVDVAKEKGLIHVGEN